MMRLLADEFSLPRAYLAAVKSRLLHRLSCPPT
jgi:hypothetical protein